MLQFDTIVLYNGILFDILNN